MRRKKMSAPPGFNYAGRVQAASPAGIGNDVKQDHYVFLPSGTKLAGSYRQPGGLVTSGGGATSPLGSGDIPGGFYVECSGSDTNGHRWAVLKPYDGENILTATAFDASYNVIQWKFTLGLYADSGNKPFAGGATTTVDVWYKPA
jgi:hypothetical protein